jgi:mRNA-degrading endonuclease toxin of MazEF toxin-antitoxin module
MRPVLVLKVMGNLSLVIPLTTQQKEGNSTAIKYYHKLESVSSDTLSSYAMFNQIRVIDQKRYIRKMGKITKEEFTEIKNLLRILYFPEDLEVLALQELLHTSLP